MVERSGGSVGVVEGWGAERQWEVGVGNRGAEGGAPLASPCPHLTGESLCPHLLLSQGPVTRGPPLVLCI